MAHALHTDADVRQHILRLTAAVAPLQITHRETMADVTEQTGAAVVTRGIFIPSGQKVPEGERKLGLLIQVRRSRRLVALPCWWLQSGGDAPSGMVQAGRAGCTSPDLQLTA
jgi:hypothetical protein